MNHEMKKNDEFYKNCTEYFEFLRKNSTVDFEFEDEYYFTMPGAYPKLLLGRYPCAGVFHNAWYIP